MNVKEFILQFDAEELYRRKIELFPLLEDYEMEALTEEQIKRGEEKYHKLFINYIESIKNTEITESNNVIFVTSQVPIFIDDEPRMNSWSCKKEEILEKAGKMFTLWNDNGEDRIEHYGYDMSPLSEALSQEIFVYQVPDIDAACEIINMMTFFGIEEESRTSRIDEVIEELNAQVRDIESGNAKTIPAEEVFARLEEEILEEASEEEKKEILKDREERKKNKNRDSVFMHVSSYENHLQCIQAILEYYRMLISSGRIKL